MISYRFVSTLIILVPFIVGCSAQTVIIPNPPDAQITVDGKPLVRNVLTYGRWIGNSYKLKLVAPKFKTMELGVSPELGDRAGGITFVCVATIIGIPFLPSVFWNGEMLNRIYVSMEPDYEIRPK